MENFDEIYGRLFEDFFNKTRSSDLKKSPYFQINMNLYTENVFLQKKLIQKLHKDYSKYFFMFYVKQKNNYYDVYLYNKNTVISFFCFICFICFILFLFYIIF